MRQGQKFDRPGKGFADKASGGSRKGESKGSYRGARSGKPSSERPGSRSDAKTGRGDAARRTERSGRGNQPAKFSGTSRPVSRGPKPAESAKKWRKTPLSDADELQISRASQIPDEERLEGRNSVTEALASGRTFNKVWYLKPLPDKQQDHRLSQILRDLQKTDAVLYPVERKILDRMAVTPSHQGIIAQVAAHEYAEVEDMLALAKERGEKPFLILLDQIQDSQNLGAIMRTADSAGVHGIIIPRRRSVALDAAAAKASVGAIEHVLVSRVTNLNRTIEELKEQGIWIGGLSMEGDLIFSSDKLDLPLALVIGSEGEGMSSLVSENCDFHLRIPMVGKINSLNASNAAAIAMYEVFRQRALVTK